LLDYDSSPNGAPIARSYVLDGTDTFQSYEDIDGDEILPSPVADTTMAETYSSPTPSDAVTSSMTMTTMKTVMPPTKLYGQGQYQCQQ
jgi:hypothetical protein